VPDALDAVHLIDPPTAFAAGSQPEGSGTQGLGTHRRDRDAQPAALELLAEELL
jgi:hypothetical protein